MRRRASCATFSRKSNPDTEVSAEADGPYRPDRVRLERAARFGALFGALVILFGPRAFAQPRLTVELPQATIQAGRPFDLIVHVRWLGGPDRYTLSPPRLHLPDTVERLQLEQSFTTLGEETLYDYRFQLIAAAPGPLSLGEVSLGYQDNAAQASGSGQGTLRETLPEATVVPSGLRSILASLLPWGFFVGIFVLGLVWLRRRAARKQEKEVPRPSEPTPKEQLQRARKCLTEGQFDEVYAILASLKSSLPPGEDPLPPADKLEAERMRVRYGGIRPNPDDLRRLLRDVARVLEKEEGANGVA